MEQGRDGLVVVGGLVAGALVGRGELEDRVEAGVEALAEQAFGEPKLAGRVLRDPLGEGAGFGEELVGLDHSGDEAPGEGGLGVDGSAVKVISAARERPI